MKPPSNPNFLFSLPPFVEWVDDAWMVRLSPSGGDDSERFRIASDRLLAVGSGVIRLSTGEFNCDNVWLGDNELRMDLDD